MQLSKKNLVKLIGFTNWLCAIIFGRSCNRKRKLELMVFRATKAAKFSVKSQRGREFCFHLLVKIQRMKMSGKINSNLSADKII